MQKQAQRHRETWKYTPVANTPGFTAPSRNCLALRMFWDLLFEEKRRNFWPPLLRTRPVFSMNPIFLCCVLDSTVAF